MQNLSVITVCIPYIRHVLAGLESGMLQTGAFRLHKLGLAPMSTNDEKSSATAQKKLAPNPPKRMQIAEDTEDSIDYAEAVCQIQGATGNIQVL